MEAPLASWPMPEDPCTAAVVAVNPYPLPLFTDMYLPHTPPRVLEDCAHEHGRVPYFVRVHSVRVGTLYDLLVVWVPKQHQHSQLMAI